MYFLFNRKHPKFLWHTLQVFNICTLCDSTNINTINEFIPNCLKHVSGDGFNCGSDSYLQFRDTRWKRRNTNLILDVTPLKEITWGCIWRTRWQVVKTPTIISNNPAFFSNSGFIPQSHHFVLKWRLSGDGAYSYTDSNMGDWREKIDSKKWNENLWGRGQWMRYE